MSPSKIFSALTTSFSLQIFSSFLKLICTLPLTMWNYMALILTNLKWAFDILLHNQFSFSSPRLYDIPKMDSEELIRITRYEGRHKEGHQSAENADDQCAVCLGEVREGDEVGELRCSHVFHHVCLETWIQFKHMTCPLCRGSLTPAPLNSGAVEVLFFKFSSFGANDRERDSWWLR